VSIKIYLKQKIKQKDHEAQTTEWPTIPYTKWLIFVESEKLNIITVNPMQQLELHTSIPSEESPLTAIETN
jgi:hypothetical protein